MPTIGIRQLARNAAKVVAEVHSTGRPVLVTRHGTPVAAVISIDPQTLEDYILAGVPDLIESLAEADEDLRKGRTIPVSDLLDELKAT